MAFLLSRNIAIYACLSGNWQWYVGRKIIVWFRIRISYLDSIFDSRIDIWGWNIVFPSDVSLDSEADAVLDDTSFIISSRSLPFVGLLVPPSSSSSDLDCSILSAFAACGLFDNSEPMDSSSVMMRYKEQPHNRALTASSRPSSSMDRMNCPNRWRVYIYINLSLT